MKIEILIQSNQNPSGLDWTTNPLDQSNPFHTLCRSGGAANRRAADRVRAGTCDREPPTQLCPSLYGRWVGRALLTFIHLVFTVCVIDE